MSKFLQLTAGKAKSATVNFTDLVGSATIAQGGTNNSALAVTAGGVLYTDGTKVVNVGAGTSGQVLTSNGASAPSWAAASGSVPLTTKGDSLFYSTLPVRHAVPADYGSLIPDSQQADGWRTAPYTAMEGRPGKNYIQYADFENGATTGWTLGTIGTLTNGLPSGSPTFGSGASGNLSISVVSSGQLAGSNSLSYVSSATTTAGDMVASSAYSIDAADQGKVLSFKFSYLAFSGASNCNFSGSSSNSFAVAVYDVTNSAFIPSTANFGMTQSSGVGLCTGTFQTPSNMTQFRLIVYNANATTGATTLYFDDFFIGPQAVLIGYAGTDWTPYTATLTNWGSGASQTYAAWRRVGDSMEIMANITSGSSPTGTTAVGLPSGYIIDNSNVKISNTVYTSVGSMLQNTQNSTVLPIAIGGASVINFGYYAGGSVGLSPQAVLPANVQNSFLVTVPIQGWSSNVQMSSDTDTRVIVASANISSTFGGSNANPIIFDSVTFDNTGSYNNTAGLFKVPVSGFYRITATIQSSTGTGIPVYAANATSGKSAYIGYTNATSIVTSGSIILQANAGDELGVYSGGTALYNATCVVNFERLSGPSVIAASESVNMRYYNSSTSISSSLSTVVWSTKDFDSHNAMNASTGVYTVPISGKYQVNCSLITGGTFSLNNAIDVQIQKNGISYTEQTNYAFASATDISVNASDIIKCNAGDTIQVQLSSTALAPSISSSNTKNWISISRVGN